MMLMVRHDITRPFSGPLWLFFRSWTSTPESLAEQVFGAFDEAWARSNRDAEATLVSELGAGADPLLQRMVTARKAGLRIFSERQRGLASLFFCHTSGPALTMLLPSWMQVFIEQENGNLDRISGWNPSQVSSVSLATQDRFIHVLPFKGSPMLQQGTQGIRWAQTSDCILERSRQMAVAIMRGHP